MATKQQPIVEDEKTTKHYEEKAEFTDVKPAVLVTGNADYTGAEAKTDPAEIALVRKIDWRLMVCHFDEKVLSTRQSLTKFQPTLCVMYFL
jgi:hypothetical protein